MLFLKALLRQSKIRLLVMLNCFKRLLCFFSSRRKSVDSDPDADDNQVEVIGSHNFVVCVQTGGDDGSKVDGIANSLGFGQHSINDDEIDGTIDNRNFPIDIIGGGSTANSSSTHHQNLSSYNRDNLNYSSHSLTSLQQQQKLNSSALSSSRHSQPPQHIPSHDQPNRAQPEPEESEPDYFQDMIPQFKKPKTIYVSKDVDPNSSDLSKKFQVSDRMVVDLDEKKFTEFGTLDDHCDGRGEGIHREAEPESTWEDMAAEEGAWDNIDHSLQEFRREKRERRLREHEQQKMLKMSNNNNNNSNIYTNNSNNNNLWR